MAARWISVACLRTESSGDDEEKVVNERLSEGRRALSRIRLFIGTVMVLLGVACALLYCFLLKEVIARKSRDRCDVSTRDYLNVLAMMICYKGRFICFSLVPLADSVHSTRLALSLDALLVFVPLSDVVRHFSDDPDMLRSCFRGVYVVTDAIFILCSVVGIFLWRDPLQMQEYMWKLIAAKIILVTPGKVGRATLVSFGCTPNIISTVWIEVLIYFATLAFALQLHWRQAVHGRLVCMVEAHSSRRAAAGIAGLVGDCTAEEALNEARKRFRMVRLLDLGREEIADNNPNPCLFARTCLVGLQKPDAFISHSWHDCSTAKWAAMQQWRTSFKAAHGREPTLWFDKCCIDQRNIDRDLRCLPIFLNSCRSLVVFCGPSYVSRLWCIMELFIFTHMHRSVGSIAFFSVLREGHEREDERRIRNSFASFDAERCECSNPADKTRLLSIICAAFGSLSAFSQAARAIFDKAGLHQVISSSHDGQGSEVDGSELDGSGSELESAIYNAESSDSE